MPRRMQNPGYFFHVIPSHIRWAPFQSNFRVIFDSTKNFNVQYASTDAKSWIQK
jgi:hypothetical protein